MHHKVKLSHRLAIGSLASWFTLFCPTDIAKISNRSAFSSAIAQATRNQITVIKSPVSAALKPSSSGLSSKQKAALQKLGIQIAVPTYVPEGFKVYKVETEGCHSGEVPDVRGVCRFRPEYRIFYQNSAQDSFNVWGLGGGLGDVGSEFGYQVKTQLLGNVSISFGKMGGDVIKYFQKPSQKQLKSPQPYLSSFPASKSQTGPFYAVSVSGEDYSKSTITPLMLEKILKSLIWLK